MLVRSLLPSAMADCTGSLLSNCTSGISDAIFCRAMSHPIGFCCWNSGFRRQHLTLLNDVLRQKSWHHFSVGLPQVAKISAPSASSLRVIWVSTLFQKTVRHSLIERQGFLMTKHCCESHHLFERSLLSIQARIAFVTPRKRKDCWIFPVMCR